MTIDTSHGSTHFRPMLASDLEEIMGIENEAYPHPWTIGIFRDCLRIHYSCWVGTRNNEIVSYVVMGIAAGESHILNLCVRPAEQRRGQGTRLLRHVLNIIRTKDVDMIFLEVRSSNKPAQQLYKDFGFDQIAERKGYYPDGEGREDALIYALSIL